MTGNSRAALSAILWGGLIAATIDIGAACLINGRSVDFILHVIAGGLLGKKSFDGGAGTAILGLALQEFMGILIAAVYVSAARIIPALRSRWLSFGLLYGVIIYFVMNYAVVPLSAWGRFPRFSLQSFMLNMLAMLLFGLIISYAARRRPNG